jgi:hypothetical protein
MNGTLSAGDVMALTRDNDGFGGVGLIILLFIFLIGIGGNGFGWGGNANGLALADIQASLYNQSQDSNSRALAASLATVNDTVLNNKYDNAILIKDLSNQMSNSVAALGNQISNQTATITNLFNQQTIDSLRDKLATTRDELSNTRQTAVITQNILGSLANIAPKPPCFYPYCQCTVTESTTTTG